MSESAIVFPNLNVTPFIVIFMVVAVLAIAFWIWMFVDVIKRQKGSKLFGWLIVVLFLGILGAIIYYFLGRQSAKPKSIRRPIQVSQPSAMKVIKEQPARKAKKPKAKQR